MWNQSYMWVSFKLSISCDCLETISYFSNNQVIWSHLEMPSFSDAGFAATHWKDAGGSWAHHLVSRSSPVLGFTGFLCQVHSMLQPHPCFILTPFTPACFCFLAKWSSPNRLPRSKAPPPHASPSPKDPAPSSHPDADNRSLGSRPPWDGGCRCGQERICVWDFSEGWSFLVPPWLGIGGISALSCQPKPSLISTAAVGCPRVQHI